MAIAKKYNKGNVFSDIKNAEQEQAKLQANTPSGHANIKGIAKGLAVYVDEAISVVCWKEFTRAWKRGYKLWNAQITCWTACAVVYRKTQPYKQSRRAKLIRNGKWFANRKLIVFARDDFTCQLCGLREPLIMQVDHKIEKSTDPTQTNSLSNLRTLCPNCHARKTELWKSQMNNTTKNLEQILPRVKFLQDNPEFLKELLEKN